MQLGKIISAGALATLMAGSSIAFAATLSDYPKPFVTADGAPDFLVVVGKTAATDDVVGAIDLATRLGGETGVQRTVGAASAGTSVEGEGKSIHTDNEKIYHDNNLKKSGLRTAMAEADLPVLLKSGAVQDSDAGTSYDYDQFIDFDDDFQLEYNKISGDLPDPDYIFGELGTSATTSKFLYRSRVIFTDEVNVTTVVGEKVKLFGAEYTWSSDTTSSKIVFFGSSETKTLVEGDEVTVTVEGKDHKVKLLTVGSATNVGVQVGSDSKSIDKGKSAVVGGLEILIDDVFFTSKTGEKSFAKLGIGARKLIIDSNNNVKTKVGQESEKTIDGTLGVVTASSGKITGIDVYVVGQDSRTDFLKRGGTMADPVWKSFSISFAGISEDVKAATRDRLDFTPSGTKDTDLVFTDDRGNKGTIKWAHITSSSDTTASLADDNDDNITVVENMTIDRNQYFVTDAGDFSRIFELSSAGSLGSADSKLDIKDVMSGKTIEVKLGSRNETSKVIDGQTYYLNASAAVDTTDVNLRVTWGDSASGAAYGDFLTVYPTLKTSKGARLALTMPISNGNIDNRKALDQLANGTKLQLPTGAILLNWNSTVFADLNKLTITQATNERGESSTMTSTTIDEGANATVTLGRTSTGGVRYNIKNENLGKLSLKMATAANTLVDQPAVLLLEEADDNNDYHTVLVRAGTETRSGNEETSVQSPVFSYSTSGAGGTGGASPDTDSDLTKYVDFFGTYAEVNTKDQNRASVWYPDSQVSANVFILGTGAKVTTVPAAAGLTVRDAAPIKTAVAKLDSEVGTTEKSTKNLILVGGPAVNSLVAELAAAKTADNKTKTSDVAWYRAQGKGTALVDMVENAFATGKAALVVAGFDAADTRAVTSVMQDFGAHASALAGKMRVVWKNGVVSTEAV